MQQNVREVEGEAPATKTPAESALAGKNKDELARELLGAGDDEGYKEIATRGDQEAAEARFLARKMERANAEEELAQQ